MLVTDGRLVTRRVTVRLPHHHSWVFFTFGYRQTKVSLHHVLLLLLFILILCSVNPQKHFFQRVGWFPFKLGHRGRQERLCRSAKPAVPAHSPPLPLPAGGESTTTTKKKTNQTHCLRRVSHLSHRAREGLGDLPPPISHIYLWRQSTR